MFSCKLVLKSDPLQKARRIVLSLMTFILLFLINVSARDWFDGAASVLSDLCDSSKEQRDFSPANRVMSFKNPNIERDHMTITEDDIIGHLFNHELGQLLTLLASVLVIIVIGVIGIVSEFVDYLIRRKTPA